MTAARSVLQSRTRTTGCSTQENHQELHGLATTLFYSLGIVDTVIPMTLARRVRDAFAEWSTTHTGFLLDSSIVDFHTPRDSEEEVVVILGLDERHSVDPSELSELRDRVARIARRAGIEPVSISVRNLDSSIVVTEAGWVRPAEEAK